MKTKNDPHAAGRPKTALDYKGNPQPINYPKGRTLARVDSVSLIQTSKGEYGYAVVYALQTRVMLTRDAACAEFGQCCIHQAECDGITL